MLEHQTSFRCAQLQEYHPEVSVEYNATQQQFGISL